LAHQKTQKFTSGCYSYFIRIERTCIVSGYNLSRIDYEAVLKICPFFFSKIEPGKKPDSVCHLLHFMFKGLGLLSGISSGQGTKLAKYYHLHPRIRCMVMLASSFPHWNELLKLSFVFLLNGFIFYFFYFSII
jgi:hypothetical protein